MSNMIAIRKVQLGSHHLSPGRTRHMLIDRTGARPFPPFTSLVIAKSRLPGESGLYLLHLCADGSGTDTHHESIEAAYHQATFEFGVQPPEWIETNEPL